MSVPDQAFDHTLPPTVQAHVLNGIHVGHPADISRHTPRSGQHVLDPASLWLWRLDPRAGRYMYLHFLREGTTR